MDLYHVRKHKKNNYWIQDYILYKVVHETDGFLEYKIDDAGVNSNDDKVVKPEENSRNVEEIIIPPEKREEMLNELRQVL